MLNVKSFAACAVAFSAFVSTPLRAEQLDASGFKRSFNIAFPGYAGTTTLSDFPVLVKLSSDLNDFQYDKCAAYGADLRFADADGTLLAHEIDTWDPDGTSLVWVKVPSLDSGTIITAYYCYKGSGSAPAVAASDVWSNGYLGVWHLNEDASPLADSTGGGKNATVYSKHASDVVLGEAGVVGKAVGFDRVSEGDDAHKGRLDIADSGNKFTGMTRMTIEMWVCQHKWVGDRRLLYRKNGDDRAFDFLLNNANTNGQQSLAFTFGTTNTEAEVTQADIGVSHYFDQTVLEQWRHYAVVYDSEDARTLKNYANGNAVQYKAVTNDYVVLPNGGSIYLGNLGGAKAFPGDVDEFRISGAARSKDWVKATHDTIANEDFASFEMPNDWTKYARRIKVSFASEFGEELAEFPVLVRLSTDIEGFSYSDFAKPNGGDLRFADADGNMLDSEIDTWDESGVSLVWVKVPALQQGTEITAYYGWAFAPAVNARDVWSNGYIGVWHLGESGMTMANSAFGGVDFTCDSGYADYVGRGIGGLVGDAVEFDLVTEGDKAHYGHLYLKDSGGKYCGRSAMTVEYWVWQRDSAHNRRLMYCKTGNDRAYDIFSQTSSGGYDKYSFVFGTTNTMTAVTNNPSLTINGNNSHFLTWKHHAAVFDSEVAGAITVYVDGTSKGSKTLAEGDSVIPTAKDLRLGNLGQGQAFPGKFDEMRISGVARSAAWLKATHDTVADESFAEYGRAKLNNVKGMRVFVR